MQKGWFCLDPETGGTEKEDIGNILDVCGISTTRKDNATIDDILSELNAGHRVIVGVDCNELWIKNEPILFKRLYGNVVNKVNDLIDNIKGKFTSVASISGSFWYDGFVEWLKNQELHAERYFLSLGNKEVKAKNERLANV